MATETLSFCPQIGAKGDIATRVLTGQMGDGYSQDVEDGINNLVESWSVSFTTDQVEAIAIRDFLLRHKGSKAFYWTPPLGKQGFYKTVGNIGVLPLGAGNYTITATLQQIFRP